MKLGRMPKVQWYLLEWQLAKWHFARWKLATMAFGKITPCRLIVVRMGLSLKVLVRMTSISDIWQNDTQQNDAQCNQPTWLIYLTANSHLFMLFCYSVECHSADCHSSKYQGTKCHSFKRHFANCLLLNIMVLSIMTISRVTFGWMILSSIMLNVLYQHN